MAAAAQGADYAQMHREIIDIFGQHWTRRGAYPKGRVHSIVFEAEQYTDEERHVKTGYHAYIVSEPFRLAFASSGRRETPTQALQWLRWNVIEIHNQNPGFRIVKDFGARRGTKVPEGEEERRVEPEVVPWTHQEEAALIELRDVHHEDFPYIAVLLFPRSEQACRGKYSQLTPQQRRNLRPHAA